MGYTEASQIINAPVEAVWKALNDIDNTSKWVAGLENAKVISKGDYGVGTLYNDTNNLGPILQVTTWKIMEFEPMSHQVHMSNSNNLPSTMELNLSSAAEGTRLTMTVDFHFMPHLGIIGRLLESLVMNRLLSRVLKQNMRQLNIYLQQQEHQVKYTNKVIEVPTLRLRQRQIQEAYEKVR